ncbi:hypothetical protein PFLUV_G00187470 [Perca fluviatilis]|uniref:Uncharacterized protein n=1 Tax=Perca fluviatilis TaxID=8168 RepID=A0A6A5EGZ4_PERFL|nr:hypothetical protein PFLUV_G00187470 [Perca fluviatilis]
MRRKEKRLLQFAGLLIAALLFLPNVGLWSLYRDRVFDNSPDTVDGIPQIQVGARAAGGLISVSCLSVVSPCRLPTAAISPPEILKCEFVRRSGSPGFCARLNANG